MAYSLRSFIFKVVPSALLFLFMIACSDEEKHIKKCVEAELEVHPAAHLVDLYKYFFQDEFGPGHLIPDRKGAEQYLDQELSEAVAFEPVDYQKLMFREQFVRVNLRMISDQSITKKELLDAFMLSALDFKQPAVTKWHKEWTQIDKIIAKMHPGLPGFNNESRMLDSLLLSGNYAVHHSQDFIREYDPHYRIIHRKYFDALMLNKKLTGKDAGPADQVLEPGVR